MTKSVDIVGKVLENPEYCPALLMGGYVVEFKKQYKKKIHFVNSRESLQELINNYSGIVDFEGRYLVIDGIGFLSERDASSLLKFIEECVAPVVCLSVYDKVLPTISSRMKFVYKKPMEEMEKIDFVSLRKCLDALEEKEKEGEVPYFERVKHYALNNPIGYYLEKMGKGRMDGKINQIISKIK